MTVQIKKTSTDEVNVSDRQIRYDVYQGDTLVESFTDVVEAMEFAEQLEN
ncbi:MAG: hypothetical protein ACO3TI_07460 [Aquiluna sp.]